LLARAERIAQILEEDRIAILEEDRIAILEMAREKAVKAVDRYKNNKID
jgi:hypothetical protein